MENLSLLFPLLSKEEQERKEKREPNEPPSLDGGSQSLNNKYLVNAGNINVELRTESGLMTGRRTLFFLQAEWPTALLQQKESQDIEILYYPGTRFADWDPQDPTKFWPTEQYFPGKTVYLEVQFWCNNGERMQLIGKCSKHGNIVKVPTIQNITINDKDVSDSHINWKGASIPKVAMCFCCTPSCFRKMDPFMFVRLRFGNKYYQSQWFQLVFRKSSKRKRSGNEPEILPSNHLPPSKIKTSSEDLAISQLASFTSFHSSIPISMPKVSTISSLQNSIPIPNPQIPPNFVLSPPPTLPSGTPSLIPFSQLPPMPKSPPKPTGDPLFISTSTSSSLQMPPLMAPVDKIGDKLGFERLRPIFTDKYQEDWELLEKEIIQLKEGEGSQICFDLLKSLTLQGKDYDSAKKSFLEWWKLERDISKTEFLRHILLPIVQETWFHGQPSRLETEQRFFRLEENKSRFFIVRVNTSDPHLTLSVMDETRQSTIHYLIKSEKSITGPKVSIVKPTGEETKKYNSIPELINSEKEILPLQCIPLPKMRWK